MSYRYPFTPYPKSWYKVESTKEEFFAFGRKLKFDYSGNQPMLYEAKNYQRTFPLVKRNGIFFAFFDEQAREPFFEIPEVSEFNDPEWQIPFVLSWRVRVHLQEIAENAVDLSHFCKVHTYRNMPVLDNFHMANHQFNIVMHSQRKFLGLPTQSSMDITYHGIGVVIANVTNITPMENIVIKVLLTITPIETDFVNIHMHVAIKKIKNPLKNK